MRGQMNFMKRVIRGMTLRFENDPPQLSYLDTFQSVGGKVWPASELMVNYLAETGLVTGKRVIELGSGCGYVGIACAALGASHVTLTDRTITERNMVHDAEGMLMEEVMPPNRLLLDICQRNIHENIASYPLSLLNVHELEWGDENMRHIDAIHAANLDYDIVIGSDVTYHAELSDSLFWTVSTLLKHMEKERIKKVVTAGATGVQTCPDTKVRFITAHQHRMDSATALTLSTAKKFGLDCTILATSVTNASFKVNRPKTDTLYNSVSNYSTNENTPKNDEDPGKYVLWQFTL